jgi:hypothetical protein
MRQYIILFVALILLSACAKTQPIYNVEKAEIYTGSGKEPSHKQVRKAIVQAIVVKTWRVGKVTDRYVEASLSKKNKIARITINYSTKSYSIKYKSSSLLLYNDGRIHRRYNAWIRGLRITIDRILTQL